jgi:hypothetical protein
LVTEFAGQGTLAEALLPDGLLQEPAVKALGLVSGCVGLRVAGSAEGVWLRVFGAEGTGVRDLEPE